MSTSATIWKDEMDGAAHDARAAVAAERDRYREALERIAHPQHDTTTQATGLELHPRDIARIALEQYPAPPTEES